MAKNSVSLISTFVGTAIFAFLILSIPVTLALMQLGGSNFIWIGLAAFVLIYLFKSRRL